MFSKDVFMKDLHPKYTKNRSILIIRKETTQITKGQKVLITFTKEDMKMNINHVERFSVS